MPQRVVVAMSGGVDSSVAAALLKQRGYDVVGVTMRTWTPRDGRQEPGYSCHRPEDEEAARTVAKLIHIPFHAVDVSREFQTEVIEYFRHEYLHGRTPNPCVRCNSRIKFGALVTTATGLGLDFDWFATGHYARVERDPASKRHVLKKGVDRSKDQSYFLFGLSQEALSRLLLPLGDRTKDEVRKLASALGLGSEGRPESQDFSRGDYSSLFDAAQPGPILDRQGNTLGQHRGLPFYTVGQRKGLGLSLGQPVYVTAIRAEDNAVVVGTRDDVCAEGLVASQLNWIAIGGLTCPIDARARIRYHHMEARATVSPSGADEVNVAFAEPQTAVTPGQAVVFYRDDEVLGGGIIERSTSNLA